MIFALNVTNISFSVTNFFDESNYTNSGKVVCNKLLLWSLKREKPLNKIQSLFKFQQNNKIQSLFKFQQKKIQSIFKFQQKTKYSHYSNSNNNKKIQWSFKFDMLDPQTHFKTDTMPEAIFTGYCKYIEGSWSVPMLIYG